MGYTIRLDSKGGPASSLMFATNGVLLRMLTGAGNPLADVTHLVSVFCVGAVWGSYWFCSVCLSGRLRI